MGELTDRVTMPYLVETADDTIMTTEFDEIYLSQVLGKNVINNKGEDLGVLSDLIMMPGESFPEVSHIIFRTGTGLKSLPWSEVALFTHVVISSVGINPPGLASYEPREGEILVRRGLLDKQIVDVDGAKVVRVNDIKLGKFNDKLCIFTVDIGFRGLLRRLGYIGVGEKIARMLRKEISATEIGWEYVQPLEPHSSRLALNIARGQMNEIHPADLADIIENIPIRNIRTVLVSIDSETTGDALYELEADMRNIVVNQLDSEQLTDILEEISPIEDFQGKMSLSFRDHRFEPAKYTIAECKDRDMTYSAPLFVTAEFTNNETGEIKSQTVFMGDFPLMTPRGTFVINGTERVVVSQIVRSPGVYFERTIEKASDKDILTAKIIPSRGAWLEWGYGRRA